MAGGGFGDFVGGAEGEGFLGVRRGGGGGGLGWFSAGWWHAVVGEEGD